MQIYMCKRLPGLFVTFKKQWLLKIAVSYVQVTKLPIYT